MSITDLTKVDLTDDPSDFGQIIADEFYGQRLYLNVTDGTVASPLTIDNAQPEGVVRVGGFGTEAYATVFKGADGLAVLDVQHASMTSLHISDSASISSLKVAAASISSLSTSEASFMSLTVSSITNLGGETSISGITAIAGDVAVTPYDGTASTMYISGNLVVDRILVGTIINAGAALQTRVQPAADGGFWFHTAPPSLEIPADLTIGTNLDVGGSATVSGNLSVLGSVSFSSGFNITSSGSTAPALEVSGTSDPADAVHTLVPNDSRVTAGAIQGFVKIQITDSNDTMTGGFYIPIYNLTQT